MNLFKLEQMKSRTINSKHVHIFVHLRLCTCIRKKIFFSECTYVYAHVSVKKKSENLKTEKDTGYLEQIYRKNH